MGANGPWSTGVFGDFATFRNGINFTKSQKGDNGIPTVDVLNMYGEGAAVCTEKLYRVQKDIGDEHLLKAGDVLFVRSSLKREGVGWASLFTGAPNPITFCGFIIRARLNQNSPFDPLFLTYFFRSDAARNWLVAGSGKVAITNISQDILERIPLPIPPLAEQRQIAAVLSAVQRAIARQERLIALTAELKKALMHKLFTEGTRGERRKQTEIGEVPERWEIVPLGSLAKIGNGSTPKRDNSAYWKGGTIPWLTSGKIHEGRITSADEFVSETAKAECHLPLVAAASLLVAITGEGKTLGNAALVEFETCVSQHLAYVQFNRADIVPAFLLYFLQSQYVQLRQMSVGAGSTKKALTCGMLKRFLVPMPSIQEQKTIAGALDEIVGKMNCHKRVADCLQSLFRTLLHQLMTAQIRVGDLDLSALEDAAAAAGVSS